MSNKSKILNILDELETKGKGKETFYESCKDIAVGAAGGYLGLKFGKPSLLWGFGVAVLGHYRDNSRLKSLGVGLMATSGYLISQSISESLKKSTPVAGLAGVNTKLKLLTDNLKEAFYLDKIIKPSVTAKPVEGIGEVQYFKYPNNEIDMGALDAIEDEITRNSELFEKRQLTGAEEEEFVSGTEEEVNSVDGVEGIEERLF